MKIKASQSIGGQNSNQGSILEERKKKDTMNFLGSPRDNALSVAHELPNDKNLEITPEGARIQGLGQETVPEKERGINKILSVQSRREKNNRSKVGQKKVLHNSRNAVIFNEFKTEDKVNQEVGLNEDKANRSKSEFFDADIESVEYDQSHLDEAISYQYSLADRSYSYEANENSIEGDRENIKEENFVEIIDQDSFEKLKEYKDRLPCLSIRKLFLRMRLIVIKLAYVIISHWMFEYASLLVIITNSVVLALEDPTDPDASNSRPMQILDQVFLALYTLEMSLKI